MSAFDFDDSLSHEENLERFFVEMDKLDPDMGAILRANIDGIAKTMKGDSRDRKATTDLNANIVTALDKLLAQRVE